MPIPKITKQNTVETFMKAYSDLRIGSDASALFLSELDLLAQAVVKAADANAKTEGRTTIMAADVKGGITSATGSTSDLAYLFKQLENLDAKSTAALAALIQEWLDAH
jgi:histone H3/H4